MPKLMDSAPVPRHQVFALENGTIVVMWSERRVQDIATGRYYDYAAQRFGRRLSDAELERLKEQRIIEAFNRSYVWLYALPEGPRFAELHTSHGSIEPRYYYLNTTLDSVWLDAVTEALVQSGLAAMGAEAHLRDGVVAITGEDGMLFRSLEEAEEALRQLVEVAPDPFNASTVAFADVSRFGAPSDDLMDEVIDLDQLIADQDAQKSQSMLNEDGT